MKFIICTGVMSDPSWKPLYEMTLATKKAYTERWDGAVGEMVGEDAWNRMCCEEDGTRKWQHTGFARTRFVQKTMIRFMDYPFPPDWILWMDADSCVTRQDFNICAHLESFGPDKWFYAAEDSNGCQSGIVALRVCAASLEALERVWNADDRFRGTGWHEQGALAEYCAEGRAVPEKKLFNAYPFHDFEAGYSWAVHCPARSDEERYESLKRCIEASR